MTTLIIILVLGFIVYVAVASLGKSLGDTQVRSSPKSPQSTDFKKKDLRDYEIRGLKYKSINDSDVAFYIGKAVSVYNSHDRYAIEIIRKDGKKLGFIPKGNVRMYNYIQSQPSKSVICYGWIERQFGEDWDNPYYGRVVIPALYTSDELEQLSQYLELESRVTSLLTNHQECTIEESFDLLKLDNELRELGGSLPAIKRPSYSHIKSVLTRLGTQLEREKRWVALTSLEEFKLLTAELPEARRSSLLRRIELGKAKS